MDLKAFLSTLTLSTLLPAVLEVVLGVVVVRMVLSVFDKALAKSKLERAAHALLHTCAKVLLYFLLALIVASRLGINVTGVVAVLSVASLAVSLAVQGVLSNTVSGITLLATHPFKAGDYVEIGSDAGTVTEVGLTYTKINTVDNKEIFIPNSVATTSKISNYSSAPSRRVDITVSASYDSPVETVKQALLRAANVPTSQFTPEPFAGVVEYGQSSISYTLRVWCASEDYWTTYFAVMERIPQCFDEAGVSMTYPHLMLHVERP